MIRTIALSLVLAIPAGAECLVNVESDTWIYHSPDTLTIYNYNDAPVARVKVGGCYVPYAPTVEIKNTIFCVGDTIKLDGSDCVVTGITKLWNKFNYEENNDEAF